MVYSQGMEGLARKSEAKAPEAQLPLRCCRHARARPTQPSGRCIILFLNVATAWNTEHQHIPRTELNLKGP